MHSLASERVGTYGVAIYVNIGENAGVELIHTDLHFENSIKSCSDSIQGGWNATTTASLGSA